VPIAANTDDAAGVGRPGLDEAESGSRRERSSFLVELRAADEPQDVLRMVRALRLAVARQEGARAGIRWASALLVPSESSCLCVLEAAEITEVLRARDVAGLHAAPVRRAYPMADPLTGLSQDTQR
jgi:hypothetical protein